MTTIKDLRTYFDARAEEMLAGLRRLVEMESPTKKKAAVDALGAAIAQSARELGAAVTLDKQKEHGDHVIARWGQPGERKQILILCHMDTVWSLGTLTERPARIEDGCFYGPGSYDMKAGIIVTLEALRGLGALGQQPNRPITALFTSDEEVGSQTSRALIEDQARRSELTLVLEPALADGSLKTSRKGTGWFEVTTTGVAAHAGGNHDEGVNAIEEMAHQILAIQRMTDYARGTTLNVGRIQGGGPTNIVPDQARVWVDMRVTSPQEGQRILEQFQSLKPVLPGASVHAQGELSRPPMQRDELMIQTYQRAKSIAAEIGLTLTEDSTGGASDGNLTAALGIPTLDGLGPVGSGAHAVHEHVVINSLPERAALIAALLLQW